MSLMCIFGPPALYVTSSAPGHWRHWNQVFCSERWLDEATAVRRRSVLVVWTVGSQVRVGVDGGLVVPVVAAGTTVIVDVGELRQHVTHAARVVSRRRTHTALHSHAVTRHTTSGHWRKIDTLLLHTTNRKYRVYSCHVSTVLGRRAYYCFYGHLLVQDFLPWCSSSMNEIN